MPETRGHSKNAADCPGSRPRKYPYKLTGSRWGTAIKRPLSKEASRTKQRAYHHDFHG